VSDPGKVQLLVRRRRSPSHRHRRNRLIRRSVGAAILLVCIVSVSTFALIYFTPSLFSGRESAPSAVEHTELTLNGAGTINQILTEARPSRPVYPYSVVAGEFRMCRS